MKITPDEVTAMPDGEFETLLCDNLSLDHRSEEIWDLLTSEPVIFRTREMLRKLLDRQAGVLHRKREELEQCVLAEPHEGSAEHRAWAVRKAELHRSWESTKIFRALLKRASEDAQVIARRRAGLRKAKRAQEHQDLYGRSVLRKLVDRVAEHQRRYQADVFEVTDADRALWKALDQLKVNVEGTRMTLREAQEKSRTSE